MSYAPPSVRARLGTPLGRIAITQPKPFGELEISQRRAICAACEWNADWTCQHIGCKVCPGAQKKLGFEPLKHLISERFFTCPFKRF